VTDAAKFKDYFGPHSSRYREARPNYPPALFHLLAILSPTTKQAWDCATGNGQAATRIAERFAAVLGTDASSDMIAAAQQHPRVKYRVTSYDTGLAPQTVGLVTVAQALHWLDVDALVREARRVLVPNGVFAAWCYSNCRITPDLDEVFDHFYTIVIGPYWPRERHHVEEGYRAIALPIDEYAVPAFEMREDWTLAEFLGYVRTWSGVGKCIAARGDEPVLAFEATMREAWGEPQRRRPVRFPLHFRVGELR
jgi:SAM-dependent methyltransferase